MAIHACALLIFPLFPFNDRRRLMFRRQSVELLATLDPIPRLPQEIHFQTPMKMVDGIYQYAHKTDLNFFQHLQANPPNGEQFNHHMGGYRQGRPS
jgi:hypothetical protein